jgi:hypothetical protein
MGRVLLYKPGHLPGLQVSLDRLYDGEVPGGLWPGNSAVEAVPTPEENIVLLPYFWKKGILNGF